MDPPRPAPRAGGSSERDTIRQAERCFERVSVGGRVVAQRRPTSAGTSGGVAKADSEPKSRQPGGLLPGSLSGSHSARAAQGRGYHLCTLHPGPAQRDREDCGVNEVERLAPRWRPPLARSGVAWLHPTRTRPSATRPSATRPSATRPTLLATAADRHRARSAQRPEPKARASGGQRQLAFTDDPGVSLALSSAPSSPCQRRRSAT
jgi:hypothetical protein